ncbi:hypothetical protein D3C79_864500 [compost metagenome]
MSSRPVRSASCLSASVLEMPARICALTKASSSASSAWLTAISSATRSIAWGNARPDSTQTTIRSRASGKAARNRSCRAFLRFSTYTAGSSHPTAAPMNTTARILVEERLGTSGRVNSEAPTNINGNSKRTAQYTCTADVEP